MLSDQKRILLNSQITVLNTYYVPAIVGCIIMSGVYLSTANGFFNLTMGYAWLLLSLITFNIFNKKIKRIGVNN